MHGLQPMAKIAPSPNDANQPPRELDDVAADAGRRPSASRAPDAERRRAGRRGQRAGCAGVEGSPCPAQDRDVQEPARSRPRTIRITPPIDPQRRQVVDERSGRERRGDAEDREHGPEPGHVRERVADREPARGLWRLGAGPRPRSPSAGRGRPGTSGRTHGDRKLMTPAARATRIVRFVPSIGRSSRLRRPGRRRGAGAAWPGWSRARGGDRRGPRPGSTAK